LNPSDLEADKKLSFKQNQTSSNFKNNDGDGFFRSINEFREEPKRQGLTTGSKYLDHLMSGGLHTGVITLFYGGPASGKTHLCHTLCVVLPSQCQALYIDTEGGFREDKIQSIAETRGLDWKQIRQNVQVAQPKNSREQEASLEEATCLFAKSDSHIKLIILDSLMYHYRGDYPGRSGLAERAHRLNVCMFKLRNLARTQDVAILVTTQSTSNPRYAEVEDPQPFGGKIISYTSTYIVHLKRAGKRNRFPGITATLVDIYGQHQQYPSPDHFSEACIGMVVDEAEKIYNTFAKECIDGSVADYVTSTTSSLPSLPPPSDEK
jgi:RecA/RadA recombinase